MDITIRIPEWYARRGLRMDKPDKRLLVWFLFFEEQLWTARQALFLIDGWQIANGSRTWEHWVINMRKIAAEEGEEEPIPDWLWVLMRNGNKRRVPRSAAQESLYTEEAGDRV